MSVAICVPRNVDVEFWSQVNCVMRSDGCVNKKLRLIMRQSLVQEVKCLLGSKIRRVLPSVIDRRSTIAGHSGITVLVGMRIE